MKQCTRCKQTLPAEAFSVNLSAPLGLEYRCRNCRKANVRPQRTTWEPVDEKICSKCDRALSASMFSTRMANKDGLQAWCKKCDRVVKLQQRYNITAAQHDEMTKGGCMICGSHTRIQIDHDHSCCPGNGRSCGRCVRGALCNDHNLGLGYFHDDPDAMLAAIDYLKASK